MSRYLQLNFYEIILHFYLRCTISFQIKHKILIEIIHQYYSLHSKLWLSTSGFARYGDAKSQTENN